MEKKFLRDVMHNLKFRSLPNALLATAPDVADGRRILCGFLLGPSPVIPCELTEEIKNSNET